MERGRAGLEGGRRGRRQGGREKWRGGREGEKEGWAGGRGPSEARQPAIRFWRENLDWFTGQIERTISEYITTSTKG